MLKPFVTALIGESKRNIIWGQLDNEDARCNQPKLAAQLVRAIACHRWVTHASPLLISVTKAQQ
jgi:hypothetical protein